MDWKRVRPVLVEVLDLPEEDRGEALERACADDPELLAHLRALLAAGRERADLFEASPATEPGASFSGDEQVGDWQLERFLGAGGMGEVWLASRRDFGQRAAIKVVRSGLAGPETLARFHRERRVLARLDHPGIARFLDGGTLPDGRPWLAMDHVEGRPIDVHCNAERLDVRARLRLFLEVLEAVAAAHQRLVVHRDLKPSNVLVQPDGTPRLLDFGIAKVLADDDADATATRAEARALTPRYASPEQVEGTPVSTRSDVYSLGVLLYELLTGASPYGDTTSSIQVLRAVCEDEPTHPSQAVRDLAPERLAAFGPDGEAARLVRKLSRDLDHVVMMALRKDPARRYASVERFADDVQRVLEERPVQAGPDSRRYRAARFVQRNRAAVATSLLALLALVGGTVASLAAAHRATTAAEQERVAFDAATGTLDFLRQFLMAPSPDRGHGRETTILEALLEARERVDQIESDHARLAAQAMLGAAMNDTGQVEAALECYSEAADMIEDLGERGTAAGTLYHDYAGTLARVGRDAEALPLVRKGLEALETRRAGRLDRILASGSSTFVRRNLINMEASLLESLGRRDEALARFRELLVELDREDPTSEFTSTLRFNLGGSLYGVGQTDEGRELMEQGWSQLREAGTAAPSTMTLIAATVGQVRLLAGDVQGALAVHRPNVERARDVLGLEHPLTWYAELGFAYALLHSGQLDESEELALSLRARADRADGPSFLLEVEGILGLCWSRQGRTEDAAAVLRDVMDQSQELQGDPIAHGTVRLALAESLARQGELEAATRELEHADRVFAEWAGPEHPTRGWVEALASEFELSAPR